MRSICCWGPGKSSIKPDRVRGFSRSICKRILSKTPKIRNSFRPGLGRKLSKASWYHPNSGLMPPLGRTVRGGSRRFRPRGLIRLLSRCPSPGGRWDSLSKKSLSENGVCGVLLPRHGRNIPKNSAILVPLGPFVNQRMEFLGRIISRQSKSPRCRPRISISAVARLVATGTLCESHSRSVCMMF